MQWDWDSFINFGALTAALLGLLYALTAGGTLTAVALALALLGVAYAIAAVYRQLNALLSHIWFEFKIRRVNNQDKRVFVSV